MENISKYSGNGHKVLNYSPICKCKLAWSYSVWLNDLILWTDEVHLHQCISTASWFWLKFYASSCSSLLLKVAVCVTHNRDDLYAFSEKEENHEGVFRCLFSQHVKPAYQITVIFQNPNLIYIFFKDISKRNCVLPNKQSEIEMSSFSMPMWSLICFRISNKKFPVVVPQQLSLTSWVSLCSYKQSVVWKLVCP